METEPLPVLMRVDEMAGKLSVAQRREAMEPIINAEIVARIAEIVAEWNAADAAAREAVTGWAKLAARAGIENGAMVQIGKAAESIAAELGVDEEANWDVIGRAAHEAYRAGLVVAALDVARR